MILWLALCLLATPPEGRTLAADMAIRAAQIDFLADNRLATNLDHVLPRRHALLIRQLNCDTGACRELAREELASMGMEAYEALCWGLHTRSPETRNACANLITRLCVCPECGGAGEMGTGRDHDYWNLCSDCDGTGDIRLKRMWHEGVMFIVPVELFPRNPK